MKFLLFILTIFIGLHLFAQNPDGFDKMAKNMAGKRAPVITKSEVEKLQNSQKIPILLDSRELEEYSVSHLPDAIWVGYDKIDWAKIDKLNKSATIVVYCSVGYRSGKLAEQLKKKGFSNVKNLYGGLFNWANNGGLLQKANKETTKNAHGYNHNWSKWLNPKQVTIVLNEK